MAVRGVIEGFYGRPWTWDERLDVMSYLAERGMTHYVYAPKDDPKHRADWRDPYDAHELVGFRRMVEESGVAVGFALSPGLSMDFASPGDRTALLAKLGLMAELGVTLLCLALDDIPPRPGLGEDHAELCTWLAERIREQVTLLLVPTDYVGMQRSSYLDAIAVGVPERVLIAWTGMSVVNDTITAAEAAARALALGGRPPLLWDNYPVNDAVMSDRLFLGPLWGRAPTLVDVCSGYLANPMVQPRASKLPLASAAAWLRGADAVDAWLHEAGDLRVLAEACDGAVPQGLVQQVADGAGHAALRTWLEAAAECGAPGLEGEADAWVEQTHAEAALGLAALTLLEDATSGADPFRTLLRSFGLMQRWPDVSRSPITVMGPRRSFRPRIGQGAGGAWRMLPDALQEDENAIDRLCRLALEAAASA